MNKASLRPEPASENLTGYRSSAWQGALWKVLSCACFAGINGLVRHLSQDSNAAHLPVYVIDFWQNVFASLVILPCLFRQGGIVMQTGRKLQHLLRVLISVSGVGLWYLSLKYMPIAKSVALSFLGPIFTVVGAHFFLKETLDRYRVSAIALSTFGALGLLQAQGVYSSPLSYGRLTLLLPILAAVAFAMTNLFTRYLARQGESAEALASYLLIGMTPLSWLPALYQWVWPQPIQWVALVFAGLFAALAHYGLNKAYSLAEVTFLMPFGLAKFIFSIGVGFAAFGEYPKFTEVAAGALIIISASYLLSLSPVTPKTPS